MLQCQIGEATLSKSKFLCEIERKNSRFCKQLLRAIVHIKLGFIADMNTQDQVQISSIDTDANSRENQADAANTQNKLESETRPDEANNSLN